MNREDVIRAAPFALRVVQRKEGRAAIVYRRRADDKGRDRFQRLAAISALGFTAAFPLLRDAVAFSQTAAGEPQALGPAPAATRDGRSALPATGLFLPLDPDWGARVACFALVASGLRDGERLLLSAEHLRSADADEAALWLGRLTREDNLRALRALRILTEAVE